MNFFGNPKKAPPLTKRDLLAHPWALKAPPWHPQATWPQDCANSYPNLNCSPRGLVLGLREDAFWEEHVAKYAKHDNEEAAKKRAAEEAAQKRVADEEAARKRVADEEAEERRHQSAKY